MFFATESKTGFGCDGTGWFQRYILWAAVRYAAVDAVLMLCLSSCCVYAWLCVRCMMYMPWFDNDWSRHFASTKGQPKKFAATLNPLLQIHHPPFGLRTALPFAHDPYFSADGPVGTPLDPHMLYHALGFLHKLCCNELYHQSFDQSSSRLAVNSDSHFAVHPPYGPPNSPKTQSSIRWYQSVTNTQWASVSGQQLVANN